MKYQYTYRNTPGDYFRFYMSNTYHSLMGIVNVIFTVAMAALIVSRWGGSNLFFRLLMVFALLIFPVFQPFFIWLRSIKSAESIKVETTVSFDEGGMEIDVLTHKQRIVWKNFYACLRRAGLLIVSPDGAHAYLLPEKVIERAEEGIERNPAAVYAFVTGKIFEKSEAMSPDMQRLKERKGA